METSRPEFKIVIEFGDGSKHEENVVGVRAARTRYKHHVMSAMRFGGITRIFDAAGDEALDVIAPGVKL